MNDTPTPRTDNAAYYMGRIGENKDGERWCDLLNESRSIERDLAMAVECIKRIQNANNYHAEDSIAIYCSAFLENL